MFQRADRILLDESVPSFAKHILSFHWEDFTPHLITYDTKEGRVEEMMLDSLGMVLSDGKQCVGTFDEGDRYHPCPGRRRVKAFAQCQHCAAPWTPVQTCVFEPKCKGDLCDRPEFCVRQHVVYLAFYGSLVKVGMTSARRLRNRGIEQGADAIAPLLECRDRMEARSLEREVSRRFKIPQEIRVEKIAQQWTLSPSREIIENNYESHIKRIGAWREVPQGSLEHLDRYPVRSYPDIPPTVAPTAGMHFGEVLGIKGKYMIYHKEGGPPLLLELGDAPARFAKVNLKSRSSDK